MTVILSIKATAALIENTLAHDPITTDDVMMCWKRASADMQSLGKHVEGMIHLKLLRH